MAPRSIWNGAVAFGMVAIPVKLYPATQSKSLSFVTIHDSCHTRLRQKRYCPTHNDDVDQKEVGRAYEYAKDQYVIMKESDFAKVQVPSTHTIEITKFVDLSSVDPLYFDRSYALEPQNVGAKPFHLLKQALETSGKVAVGKISLRQKEQICCLRPFENGIMMSTMHYPDEIRGTDELNLPDGEGLVTKQELQMAETLIDQLSGEFEPQEYHDDYRTAMEKIVESRLGNVEPVTVAPIPSKGKVGDLMEALKASIDASKKAEANEAGAAKAKSSGRRAKKSKVVARR